MWRSLWKIITWVLRWGSHRDLGRAARSSSHLSPEHQLRYSHACAALFWFAISSRETRDRSRLFRLVSRAARVADMSRPMVKQIQLSCVVSTVPYAGTIVGALIHRLFYDSSTAAYIINTIKKLLLCSCFAIGIHFFHSCRRMLPNFSSLSPSLTCWANVFNQCRCDCGTVSIALRLALILFFFTGNELILSSLIGESSFNF